MTPDFKVSVKDSKLNGIKAQPTGWNSLNKQLFSWKEIMGNIGLKGEGGGLIIKLYYTTLLHIIWSQYII